MDLDSVINAVYKEERNPKSLLSILPYDIFKIIVVYLTRQIQKKNRQNWFREIDIDKDFVKAIRHIEKEKNVRFPIKLILDMADKNWRKNPYNYDYYDDYEPLYLHSPGTLVNIAATINLPKKIIVTNDWKIPTRYLYNMTGYKLIEPGHYWIWKCSMRYYILYGYPLDTKLRILKTSKSQPSDEDFVFQDNWYNKYKKI